MIRLLVLLLPLVVHAAELPRPGKGDPRVQRITYAPEKVVRLVGQFGMSTLVVLHAEERIKAFAGGYLSAWKITNLGDHRFNVALQKPDADTNLSVITTRADGSERTYHFELVVHSNGGRPTLNGVPFQVTFDFPQDKVIAQNSIDMRAALRRGSGKRNTDYSVEGAASLRPRSVWDDGTFTYFHIYAQTDMPAVYATDPLGNETLVNTHQPYPNDPDVVAIHKIGRKFVFRRGDEVACVFNDGPPERTDSIGTGTTSPAVRRVLR